MRTTSIRLFLFAAAVCAATLDAQPAAYPAADRAAKRAATAIFLDRNQPVEARLAAIERAGYPDEETFPKLRAVGVDRNQPDLVRREALWRLRDRRDFIEIALKILEDPDDGGEELDAQLIMDLSARATFAQPAATLQRVQAVIRKLLDDPRPRVRLFAFREAVANHDTVALDRLANALRTGTNMPIPVADAIEMLHFDGPHAYLDAIRPYLASPDPLVQARAAHALSIDPVSRPRLVELIVQPATAPMVRRLALRGLAAQDERFGAYAIPLVANGQEDPDIRYAAMHSYTGRLNYHAVDAEEQVRFALVVERLAADRSLAQTQLGIAARELRQYLRRAFPAIRRHFEIR